MKLITRATMAAEAFERYRRQYHISEVDLRAAEATLDRVVNPSLAHVAARLKALGESPGPDAVDAATGVKGWTLVPACDECKGQPDRCVEVGDEPDHESMTARLCLDCLRKAVLLAGGG